MESKAPPREVTLKPKAPPAAVLQAGVVAKQVVPIGEREVTLFEDKITVRDSTADSEALPRRYTLTHNDRTAELRLSIGTDYECEDLNRQKQDEVLAELTGGEAPKLAVRCQVQGPELSGKSAEPRLRRRIFEKEMPFALAVLRYGDRFFFERHPELDQAEVIVEFAATDPEHQSKRAFGRVTDYRVTRIAGESRRLVVGAAAVAAVGIGALVIGKLRNR
jgi:Staygreen protein